MSGGGETLRAVMEASSVYSNPAFYCVPLNAKDGTMNAMTSQRAFHQLHRELWFLCTGIVATATNGEGGFVGFERMDQPEFVRLYDPQNNSDYFRMPTQMQYSLFGEATINNPFTLPEYLLFAPSALIGVEWLGLNYNATVEFKMLTLVGIEYGMKDQ